MFFSKDTFNSLLALLLILGSFGVVLGLVRPKKLLSGVIGPAVLIPLAFQLGMPMLKQFSAQYGHLPVFIGCALLAMAIMASFEFTRQILAGIFENFIYENIRIILIVTGVIGALAAAMAALGKWVME
jgi:hypothetical protein